MRGRKRLHCPNAVMLLIVSFVLSSPVLLPGCHPEQIVRSRLNATEAIISPDELPDRVAFTGCDNGWGIADRASSDCPLYRYDGSRWLNVRLGDQSYFFTCVETVRDSVWLTGMSSPYIRWPEVHPPARNVIVNFTGKHWFEYALPDAKGRGLLRSISMYSNEAGFAVAPNSLLQFKDGQWTEVPCPKRNGSA